MAFVDEIVATEYRAAWAAWQKQIEHVHRVFLEDERLRPDQIKGLLNRESRAKEKYEEARLRLLGIESGGDDDPASTDANPFRQAP